MEIVWTAVRLSAARTRLQVIGLFVPEKRMLGVGGIIRKATKEVSICYAEYPGVLSIISLRCDPHTIMFLIFSRRLGQFHKHRPAYLRLKHALSLRMCAVFVWHF